MSQSLYKGSSSFKESWGEVTRAYWSKNNSPFSSHIITEDVLERKLVDGKLHTTRFLLKRQRLPGWILRLLPPGNGNVKVLERSVIDPVNKTCEMTQENINCSTVCKVYEVLRFKEQGSRDTLCERETSFTSQISRIIAKGAMARYKTNVINTDKSINCVLGLLDECGSKFLPSIARNLSKFKEFKAAKSMEFKEFKDAKSEEFKEAKDKAKERVRTESQCKFEEAKGRVRSNSECKL